MKRNAVFFCICAILTGCSSSPKVNVVAEAEALRTLELQWASAIQTKDIAKVMTYFSPESMQIEPGKDILTGLQSIQQDFEMAFADTTYLWDTFAWTNDKVEVSASGDLAYVSGTNVIKSNTPDGTVEFEGRGVDIWKKINGDWKCVVSIWNSNKP
jgi:ketosteroid isomerase-like protein